MNINMCLIDILEKMFRHSERSEESSEAFFSIYIHKT